VIRLGCILLSPFKTRKTVNKTGQELVMDCIQECGAVSKCPRSAERPHSVAFAEFGAEALGLCSSVAS